MGRNYQAFTYVDRACFLYIHFYKMYSFEMDLSYQGVTYFHDGDRHYEVSDFYKMLVAILMSSHTKLPQEPLENNP